MKQKKAMAGVAWFLIVGATGVATGALQSPNAIVLLVGLAVVPVGLMYALWRPASQTMSESIQNARR